MIGHKKTVKNFFPPTPDRYHFFSSSYYSKPFLEYAYNREVSITADNVYELLPAADQFNIDGIVFKCSKFLEASLTPRNCIGLR